MPSSLAASRGFESSLAHFARCLDNSPVVQIRHICRFHPNVVSRIDDPILQKTVQDFSFFVGNRVEFDEGGIDPLLYLPVGHIRGNCIGSVDALSRLVNMQHACDEGCGTKEEEVTRKVDRATKKVTENVWRHRGSGRYLRNLYFVGDAD